MIVRPRVERFSVMALFEPIDVGARFPRSAWPAHVTLAANFVTSAPAQQVVAAIDEADILGRRLTFRFGQRALFGLDRDVPVRLAESPQVGDVHRRLADRLAALRGFTADEPAHWGDGYHPHLTLRPEIGVDADDGEVRTASHVAVARLDGATAEIVASFPLAEGPSR